MISFSQEIEDLKEKAAPNGAAFWRQRLRLTFNRAVELQPATGVGIREANRPA